MFTEQTGVMSSYILGCTAGSDKKKLKRYCFNCKIKIHYVLIFRNSALNLRGKDLFGCKYKKHKYLENFVDRLNEIGP